MPIPRFEPGASDLWSNMLPVRPREVPFITDLGWLTTAAVPMTRNRVVATSYIVNMVLVMNNQRNYIITWFPAFMWMFFAECIVPYQLPAPIVCHRVLIINYAITLLLTNEQKPWCVNSHGYINPCKQTSMTSNV